VDDAGQLPQCAILWPVFFHQDFERAAPSPVLVGISGARRVKSDGAMSNLKPSHVRCLDEPKASARVDEAPDQPAGGRSVDPDF
jgi:hypothetical protein